MTKENKKILARLNRRKRTARRVCRYKRDIFANSLKALGEDAKRKGNRKVGQLT